MVAFSPTITCARAQKISLFPLFPSFHLQHNTPHTTHHTQDTKPFFSLQHLFRVLIPHEERGVGREGAQDHDTQACVEAPQALVHIDVARGGGDGLGVVGGLDHGFDAVRGHGAGPGGLSGETVGEKKRGKAVKEKGLAMSGDSVRRLKP